MADVSLCRGRDRTSERASWQVNKRNLGCAKTGDRWGGVRTQTIEQMNLKLIYEDSAIRGKACVSESRLAIVLLLTG